VRGTVPRVTETVIAARGLRKRFGKDVALEDVDLDVSSGASLGLLGPAGAGKSTLIRLLAGLVRPTAGTLTIGGALPGSVAARRRLGVVLQDARLYGWMTVRETLAFGAELANVPRDSMPARIDAAAGHFNLEDVLARRVSAVDRPTRGRLSIAQAVIGDPDVLLLDEPSAALDPESRRLVLGFLATLRGRTTVVLASHRFADVNAVCDRVLVLDAGRVTLEAPIDEARRRMPSVYVIHTATDGGLALDGVVARLRAEPWVSDVTVVGGTLRVVVSDDDRALRELVPAVVSTGMQVSGFRHEPGSVEGLAVDGRRA
jgi:ABC-2 type transport system ATP-binding protein